MCASDSWGNHALILGRLGRSLLLHHIVLLAEYLLQQLWKMERLASLMRASIIEPLFIVLSDLFWRQRQNPQLPLDADAPIGTNAGKWSGKMLVAVLSEENLCTLDHWTWVQRLVENRRSAPLSNSTNATTEGEVIPNLVTAVHFHDLRAGERSSELYQCLKDDSLVCSTV